MTRSRSACISPVAHLPYMLAALVATLLVLAAMPARASDSGFDVEATLRSIGEADYEKGGSASVLESGAGLRYRWFALEYVNRQYDWNDTRDLPFGNGNTPWDNLHALRLRGDVSGAFGESGLGWFLGGALAAGWEEEMDDAWGVTGTAGLAYSLGGISLRGGVAAWAHPTGMRLIPIAAADWGNQRDMGFSATVGLPETMLRYRTSDMLSFRAGGHVDGETYRLSNESSVEREGYMRNTALTFGTYVDFTPMRDLTLTLGAEYVTHSEMTIYDKDGDARDSYDVDDAPAFMLRMRYAF